MEIQFAKSFMSYLKLKKIYDIITDTYLEEGEVHFSESQVAISKKVVTPLPSSFKKLITF